MSSIDEKISDVQRKIERERQLITGYTNMRHQSNNPTVQTQADRQIRDCKKFIEYLENSMQELHMRQMEQSRASMSAQSNGRPREPDNTTQQGPSYGRTQSPPYGGQTGYGGQADYGDRQYTELGGGQGVMPAKAPFGPPGPGAPAPKARPNYSRLDLIKYDTPHLGLKIQLMLSQLQFKYTVEKQYKEGIDKIVGSYDRSKDKKVWNEAQAKRIESMQKITLLRQALKRYEDLHVDMETTDTPDDDSLNAPSMRRPLTGHLTMRIQAVSELNHTDAGRFAKGPETFVIMKIEDELKARTKATKSDKWADELHEIDIDKGNEIELTVYDKAGGNHPVPIGMLWIRITDIAEEMRRKRIETEFSNSGWVSADRTLEDAAQRPDLQFNPPPGQSGFQQGFNSTGQQQGTQPMMIEAWFTLEPVGTIHLSMSFVKETRERKNLDIGLGRKGAIRQRKENVHELYGHKFVSQQFYNIMRCALCGEFLKYAVGMQCTDCKYLCHEKCYPEVVTKCISKSNSETDPDEAKINHRVPHRFENFGNMGANWCCHCGYILPLGRKNCKKCRECKLMCHSQCIHLVPDFCGLSMKDANKILAELKRRKNMTEQPRVQRMADRSLRDQSAEKLARPPPSTQNSYTTADQGRPAPMERWSYQDYPPPEATPTATPPNESAVAAAKGSVTGAKQQISPTTQRPAPPRTTSSQIAAAQAAVNALQGKSGGTFNENRTQPAGNRTSPYPTSPAKQTQAPQYAPYDPSAYQPFDQPQPASQPSLPGPPAQRPQQPYYPLAQQPEPASQPQPHTAESVTKFLEKKNEPPPSQVRGSGRRIGLDHFNFLAVLGKGNFGKVMLAETKASKQLYAIKVLKKEFIIENDEVESTKSERDVFIIANRARHPFLLNLHACFQTETRVYFVMEYISGGDLMLHIQRGQFGTKRAQFYAAEVCLALKYFHENGVVYRDLKLDNILLTLDGHIKIADYGLCKKDMYYGSTTSTFCGTPEFMAPEILLDKKYGRAVDWWAFGVLIYQMLLQQSPFRGEDEDEIYDAILADEPLYPIHMPRDSVSILQKLLTREPELRLGSGPTDAQEIMSHAFFRNINWDEVYDKRVPAPFLPQIKSATDTSNFDSEFTSVTPVLTPVQSVLSPAKQEEFRGFSYSADFL